MEQKQNNIQLYLAWDSYLQEPIALKKDFTLQKATAVRLHNVASGYATKVELEVAVKTYDFSTSLDELEKRYTNLVEL